MSRLIPAWQAKIADYSLEDYVYILTPEIGSDGWPNFKLVHRLAPVDPEEQARLRKIKPHWAKDS